MNEKNYLTADEYNRKIEIVEIDEHVFMRLTAPGGVTLRPISYIWELLAEAYLLHILRGLTWGEFKGLKMALHGGIHDNKRSRKPGYVELSTMRGLLAKGLVAQSQNVNAPKDLLFATHLGRCVMGVVDNAAQAGDGEGQ